MTVRRHRRYSTEFKIQLVQAYLDGEGSVRKIATRHGVPHSLLAIWIRKYEAGELAEEVYLQEQVSEYEACDVVEAGPIQAVNRRSSQ